LLGESAARSIPVALHEDHQRSRVDQGLQAVLQRLSRCRRAAGTFGQLLGLAADGGNVHSVDTVHSRALGEEDHCGHGFNLGEMEN